MPRLGGNISSRPSSDTADTRYGVTRWPDSDLGLARACAGTTEFCNEPLRAHEPAPHRLRHCYAASTCRLLHRKMLRLAAVVVTAPQRRHCAETGEHLAEDRHLPPREWFVLRETKLAGGRVVRSVWLPVTAGHQAESGIASAANFAEAAKEIAQLFQKVTGYRAILSFGSTGQLFAQITQDAPFEGGGGPGSSKEGGGGGLGIGGQRLHVRGRQSASLARTSITSGQAVLRTENSTKLRSPIRSTRHGAAALEDESLGLYESWSENRGRQQHRPASQFVQPATQNSDSLRRLRLAARTLNQCDWFRTICTPACHRTRCC